MLSGWWSIAVPFLARLDPSEGAASLVFRCVVNETNCQIPTPKLLPVSQPERRTPREEGAREARYQAASRAMATRSPSCLSISTR